MEKETSKKTSFIRYMTLILLVGVLIRQTDCFGEKFAKTLLGQMFPLWSYVEMDDDVNLFLAPEEKMLEQISGLYAYMKQSEGIIQISQDPVCCNLDYIKCDNIDYITYKNSIVKQGYIKYSKQISNPIYINKNRIESKYNSFLFNSINNISKNAHGNKIVDIKTNDATTKEVNISIDSIEENDRGIVDINKDKLVDINANSAVISDSEKRRRQELVLEKESRFLSADERTIFYENLKDFEYLKSVFYQIDRSTYISENELNAQELLSMDLSIDKNSDGPEILIYHTHSQEAFADSRESVREDTVWGAGEYLTECLTEYGFHVLHHDGQYDVENRDFAYSAAAPALEKILQENPSIQVIIDLHRDGVDEQTKLVSKVNGVDCAQFMFFNGLSRTNATGEIDYLYNPFRNENLAMSFQLQLKANEYYPDVVRKIYLKGYRYNMQYRGKSILVEVGAQTNTVEEIYNSMPILARILAMVLSGE